jgi:hypothetical protein
MELNRSAHWFINILTNKGETLTFPQVVVKFEDRFGDGGGCRQLFRLNFNQCLRSPLNPLNSRLWKQLIRPLG